MPSVDELRAWLDVQATAGDPVEISELRSPKTYRQALEREFIRRRPGQYPQAWLAQRLGVSTRSIYNYHRAEGIASEPCFLTMQLTWSNYERFLPPPGMAKRIGLNTRARFIEDEHGKRYPASIGVAQRMLARGHELMTRTRLASNYQIAECEKHPEWLTGNIEHATVGKQRYISNPSLCQLAPT